MLEQLEEIEGVVSAMANHTGTLVRVSLTDSADRQLVASELASILKKQNRKPKQLFGDDVAKAITDEQWRVTERIGELSEIEFRTVFSRRVDEFIEEQDLDEETVSKLTNFSQDVLNETEKSDSNTAWVDFCQGLARRMLEKAKLILSDEELDALEAKLKVRVQIVDG